MLSLNRFDCWNYYEECICWALVIDCFSGARCIPMVLGFGAMKGNRCRPLARQNGTICDIALPLVMSVAMHLQLKSPIFPSFGIPRGSELPSVMKDANS
jgi:hypothetical protein